MITRIGLKLDSILRIVGSSMVATSVSLLFIIAAMREVLGMSFDYLSDFTVWLMVYSFMLLLGPVYRDGAHVSIGVVFERLPRKARLGVALLNKSCTLAFAILLALGGVKLMHFLISLNQMYARVIRVPMWVAQICIPIGASILVVYATLDLWRTLKEVRRPGIASPTQNSIAGQ